MSRPSQLHSQIGFYLLPPKSSVSPGSKASTHNPRPLDAITEEELSDTTATNSPTLIRKNTAKSGLMFDRPTRHPSLDDLRQFGRGRPRHQIKQPVHSRLRSNSPPVASPNLLSVEDVGQHQHRRRAQQQRQSRRPRRVERQKDEEHDVDEEDGKSADTETPPSLRCAHPQARICQNIKYNLQQMRLREQMASHSYRLIIDAVVKGPAEVESLEAEEILGISANEFISDKLNRERPSDAGLERRAAAAVVAATSDDDVGKTDDNVNYVRSNVKSKRKKQQVQEQQVQQQEEAVVLPIPSLNVEGQDYYEGRSLRLKKYSFLMSRPGLRKQFERFAQYLEPRASGDYMTLSQTEKWFKQAGVIDDWTITSIDTANFFRKISKGSRWLDYDLWRVFLEELAWKKRVNLEYLVDKLEFCGKPTLPKAATGVKVSNEYGLKRY